MGRIFGTGSGGRIFGGQQQDEYSKLANLAIANNVPLPKEKKSAFDFISNALSYPSRKTEELLLKGGEALGVTKGKTYEEAFGNMGLENKPEEIDLNDVASFATRLVLDPINLVGPLGLGKKALAGVKAVGKAAKAIKPISKAAEFAGELFVPLYKTAKVSPQFANEFTALSTKIGAKQSRVIEEISNLFKGFSPEIRTNIGKLVESTGKGTKLSEEEAKAVVLIKNFIKQNITDPEVAAKINPTILADYFPRKADRDAIESMLRFGGKKLSLGLGGAEKARSFATQAAGEAAGVVYREPIEALAIRATKSEAARENVGFIRRLIGGEIKDVDNNPLVQALNKANPLKEGYIGARIDKNGLRIGNKFLGFYPEVTEAGKKIIGVTRRGGNFQVPIEIGEELSKYFNTFTSDEATNVLLRGIDKALGIWKGSVTSIFPAFHIRNFIGNLTNMWLGDFDLTKVDKFSDALKLQRGLVDDITVGGTKVTKELLEDLGVTGRGWFGKDIPEVIQETLGNKTIAQKLNPLQVFEKGRNIGSFVEDNSRIAFFLERLEKGYSIPEAVGQVKKYLFDYGALTPFEKNVMKRVIPFYSWVRNNVPLQIENLISKPQKFVPFVKLSNLASMTQDEKEIIPDYIKEGIHIPIGKTKEGELDVLSSLGLPFEDLGRLWRGDIRRTGEREIIGQMGPWANLAEIVTKRDFYRGKNTEDLAYTYGRSAKNYPKVLKDLIDFREEKTKGGDSIYYVNPDKYKILNLFGSRIYKGISKWQEKKSLPESVLTLFEFWNRNPINVEQATQAKEREKIKALEKLLIEKGIMKEFRKSYIPK